MLNVTLPYISPFTVIGEKGDFLRRFFLLYRIEITVLAGESRLMKRESGENPEQCPLLYSPHWLQACAHDLSWMPLNRLPVWEGDRSGRVRRPAVMLFASG